MHPKVFGSYVGVGAFSFYFKFFKKNEITSEHSYLLKVRVFSRETVVPVTLKIYTRFFKPAAKKICLVDMGDLYF